MDKTHSDIYNCFVFTDTSKIAKSLNDAIVKCKYSCVNNKCDFTSCLFGINNKLELNNKFNMTDNCKEIICDIENHPSDYLPHVVDSFAIKRMNINLVLLERTNANGENITGVIEYNDLIKLRFQSNAK